MECHCIHPQKVDYLSSCAQTNLLKNFAQTGWSPVSIPVEVLLDQLDDDETSKQLVQQHRHWQDLCVELFDKKDEFVSQQQSNNNNYRESIHQARFIQNESGSVEYSEPKQSWEWHRCTAQTTTSVIDLRLQAWTNILMAVAILVRKTLELPENVLLVEDDASQSFDLLRAFYYETLPLSSAQEDSLGSSPHTDWGSFTVVWQDNVGGLQMHCKEHDCWNTVSVDDSTIPTKNNNNNCISFVIHVGDVTSLCVSGKWPSPLHRVVSPTVSRRNSLVYFCYPHPDTSINMLSQQLGAWKQKYLEENAELLIDTIDYDDYFILHNQSQNNSCTKTMTSTKQQFEQIRSLALGQVLRQKWKQVER